MNNQPSGNAALEWLQDLRQPWRAMFQIAVSVLVGYFSVMIPSVLAGTDPACLSTPVLIATFSAPLFVICTIALLTKRIVLAGLIISGLVFIGTTFAALHGAGPVWPWIVYVIQNTCLPLACTLVLSGLVKAAPVVHNKI